MGFSSAFPPTLCSGGSIGRLSVYERYARSEHPRTKGNVNQNAGPEDVNRTYETMQLDKHMHMQRLSHMRLHNTKVYEDVAKYAKFMKGR